MKGQKNRVKMQSGLLILSGSLLLNPAFHGIFRLNKNSYSRILEYL
jgi:hypothetical protein